VTGVQRKNVKFGGDGLCIQEGSLLGGDDVLVNQVRAPGFRESSTELLGTAAAILYGTQKEAGRWLVGGGPDHVSVLTPKGGERKQTELLATL